MTMTNSRKSYSELMKLNTFEERFEYLKLSGNVGEETFGSKRIMNQVLYQRNPEWKRVRDKVIIRDNGCDLGVDGYYIKGERVIIHHINPITVEDVLNNDSSVFDMDNLISTRQITHNAIHYANENMLITTPVERTKNDTCPWKK